MEMLDRAGQDTVVRHRFLSPFMIVIAAAYPCSWNSIVNNAVSTLSCLRHYAMSREVASSKLPVVIDLYKSTNSFRPD
jgi:hypothetical protein